MLSKYLWSASVSIFCLEDAEESSVTIYDTDVKYFWCVSNSYSTSFHWIIKGFCWVSSRGGQAPFHICALSLTPFLLFPYMYCRPSTAALDIIARVLWESHPYDPLDGNSCPSCFRFQSGFIRRGRAVMMKGGNTGESSGNSDSDWHTVILPRRATWLSPGCLNHCDRTIHVSLQPCLSQQK